MLESFIDFRKGGSEKELPIVLNKTQFETLLGLVPTGPESGYAKSISVKLIQELNTLESSDKDFIERVESSVNTYLNRNSIQDMVNVRHHTPTLYNEIGVITASACEEVFANH